MLPGACQGDRNQLSAWVTLTSFSTPDPIIVTSLRPWESLSFLFVFWNRVSNAYGFHTSMYQMWTIFPLYLPALPFPHSFHKDHFTSFILCVCLNDFIYIYKIQEPQMRKHFSFWDFLNSQCDYLLNPLSYKWYNFVPLEDCCWTSRFHDGAIMNSATINSGMQAPLWHVDSEKLWVATQECRSWVTWKTCF